MLMNYIIEYKFDFYFSSGWEAESYLRSWVKVVMGSIEHKAPYDYGVEKVITINPIKIKVFEK